jgi:hypothetical protein
VKLLWLWTVPQCTTLRAIAAFKGLQKLAFRSVDRRAICPARHQTVFQFAVGIKSPRQKPANQEYDDDDAERD